MAKYDIKSLNYIASGQNRSFLNIDMQLNYYINHNNIHFLRSESSSDIDIGTSQGEGYWYPTKYIQHSEDVGEPISQEKYFTQIILNEQQENYIETNPSSKKNIRLYLSCDLTNLIDSVSSFNNARFKKNQTFMLDSINKSNDKNNLTSNGAQILNMYDFRDITIKKQGAHTIKNLNIAGTDFRHDIYVPQLDEQPIGFCQTQMNDQYSNDALVITNSLTKDPEYLKTSFQTHGTNYSTNGLEYTTEYGSTQMKTYLYDSPSAVSTFLQGFTPIKNYSSIQKSLIIDMPVDSHNSTGNANDIADYDDGIAYYARLHTTKSTLNSLYTTDLCSYVKDDVHDQMNNCRIYCGIDSSSGYPYLKYYDNATYDTIRTSSDQLLNVETEQKNSYDNGSDIKDVLPYQKIEFIYSSSENVNSAKHKSNMFNIEILNSQIPEVEQALKDRVTTGQMKDTDSQLSNRLFTLKTDIQHSIRQIVENIAPVNTQLFNVEFGTN